MKKTISILALAGLLFAWSTMPAAAQTESGTMGGPGYGMGQEYGYRPDPGYGYGPGAWGPGYGYDRGYGYGPGWMEDRRMHRRPGMMDRRMGPGYGYGMGPGMMERGYGYGMGPGMMQRGYGPGGRGYYGPGPGYGPWFRPLEEPLTREEARDEVQSYLDSTGNPHLKIGEIEEKEDHFQVEIVTKEKDSLVDRLVVDKDTGRMMPAY